MKWMGLDKIIMIEGRIDIGSILSVIDRMIGVEINL
jgi:hypothetical protein